MLASRTISRFTCAMPNCPSGPTPGDPPVEFETHADLEKHFQSEHGPIWAEDFIDSYHDIARAIDTITDRVRSQNFTEAALKLVLEAIADELADRLEGSDISTIPDCEGTSF